MSTLDTNNMSDVETVSLGRANGVTSDDLSE